MIYYDIQTQIILAPNRPHLSSMVEGWLASQSVRRRESSSVQSKQTTAARTSEKNIFEFILESQLRFSALSKLHITLHNLFLYQFIFSVFLSLLYREVKKMNL